MARKGAVKTVVLGFGIDIPNGESPEAVSVDEWTIQDDVRIVAAELACWFSQESYASIVVGANESAAYLTRSGSPRKPGEILQCACSVLVYDAGVAAIMCVGQTNNQVVLEYPEGTGMDFDAGEHVNLWIGGSARATGGKVYANAMAIIHYIER